MYAISLAQEVHPNDRMFFDTVDQVIDTIRWALSSPGFSGELVLTIEED